MSLDQNLMGLGMPAAQAVRIANGGTGPVSFAASASAPTIGSRQNVIFVNSGSGKITLPTIGGSDTAPEIADDFFIHNGLSGVLTVVIPSGVSVSLQASNQTGSFTINTHQNVSLWVVSATQWMGQAG